MKPGHFLLILFMVVISACGNDDEEFFIAPDEDPAAFSSIAEITIGGEGAAEIAAFDGVGERLFVVNNAGSSQIDVIDFSDPNLMSVTSSIDVSSIGGGVNSVSVSGKYLAAAIEADDKTDNGSVIIYHLSDLTVAATIEVGALPDMVTFTPDGKYILVANEGEPGDDYKVDPAGTVSIIDVSTFAATTLNFSQFNGEEAILEQNGFRVTGPGADLSQDVEPEFISVSEDSKTAYVVLQENNGLAIIDIPSGSITDLVALGLKDYSASGNEIDPSDRDGKTALRSVPANIYGVYMPDAIDVFSISGATYVITANEGDGREYFYDADKSTCDQNGGEFDEEDGCLAFTDESRLEDLTLDPAAFPDAADIRLKENFGRLKVMTTNGDSDGDGDFDSVYAYGTRSFSILDAKGNLIFDSGSDLESRVIDAGLYEDSRSDDKGVEPEGVVVGLVNDRTIAFIGLERVDAVAVYDISNPQSPQFLSILKTGDAPEGMVFINAENSPIGRSLLVVTCEDDGTVWVYTPAQNI